MTRSISTLSKALQFSFTKEALLIEALTHRSKGQNNNERLEFLGDSILSFVITTELYGRFPLSKEGDLSRFRASLVNGETLAILARKINLGDYLFLGTGELKSGGAQRSSILANAFEAIIGAIYLDSGLEKVTQFILISYSEDLNAISTERNFKDPKTLLQEHLQSKGLALPEYNILSVEGEAHAQKFSVSCRVDGVEETIIGSGTSRRKAEQDVAQNVLNILHNDS